MEFFIALVVVPLGCKLLEKLGAQGNIGPVCANVNFSSSGNSTSVSTSFTPPPSSEPSNPYLTKEQQSNIIIEEEKQRESKTR